MLRLTYGLGNVIDSHTGPGGYGTHEISSQLYWMTHREGFENRTPKTRTGYQCLVANSRTINSIAVASWKVVGPDGKGYNSNCDCYCPGYRPEMRPPEIVGLGAVPTNEAYSTYATNDPLPFSFPVCVGHHDIEDGCKDCPPPSADCPTCPKPPPALLPQQQSALDEWGTNLGWLLAGAVIAGGGYYAYKKGVFKKGYWKKIGKRRRR
jgi:hypothetical protein